MLRAVAVARWIAVLGLLASSLECGSASSGPAAGSPPPSPPVPLPTVPDQGGRVIAHVKLVTLTFQGDPYTAQLQAFGDWLVQSQWLGTVGAEYGVGPGTHRAKLVIDYTPPPIVSAGGIETYLAAGIGMGIFPQPDPDTLYVIYYPTTTKPSGLGCEGPWWGHRTVTSPVRFAYAAIPECPPPAGNGWSQIESIEQDASHEIIEAATDPDRDDAPTYAITDPSAPFLYMGSEIADLCVGLDTSEAGFFAQRIWSNAAAAAGRPPCVPAPAGDVVFEMMPASPKALTIPAGGSAQVPLTAWSSAPRAPWAITALAYPGFHATVSPTGTLDRPVTALVSPGDHATLTVSVPAGTASGSRGIVVVDSLTASASGAITSGPYAWPILVQVP